MISNKALICYNLIIILLAQNPINSSERVESDFDEPITTLREDSIGDNQENALIADEELRNLNFNTESERQIHSYVINYLLQDREVQEAKWRRNIRFVLNGTAVLFGGTAGIAYVTAPCLLTGGNLFVCGALGTGVVVSYGIAATWVALRLASHMNPISEEELYFYNLTNSHRVLKNIIPNVLGLVSALPDLYSLYVYNTYKWLAIPGFVVSCVFKSQGFYELIDIVSIIKRNALKKVLPEENMFQEKAQAVRKNIIEPSFREDYGFRDTHEIKTDMIRKLTIVLDSRVAEEVIIIPQEWVHKNKLKRTFQALGIIFPVSPLLVNGSLALEGLQLINSSPIFYVPAIVVMMTPSFLLDCVVVTLTMGEFFDLIYNKIRGNNQVGYIKTFHPILHYLIPCAALLFSALSGIGNGFVSYDIISRSSLVMFKVALPIFMVGSSIIFESYTGNDLYRRFVEMYDGRFGSPVKKVILHFRGRLEIVANMYDSIIMTEGDVLLRQEGMQENNRANRRNNFAICASCAIL